MGKKKKNKKPTKAKKQVLKVKKVFNDHPSFQKDGSKIKKNPDVSKKLIRAIAGSVRVNKVLLKRDKKRLKKFQENYYQLIFNDFKKLVEKHNENLAFKAEELQTKVNSQKIELRKLKQEVNALRKEKELLINE